MYVLKKWTTFHCAPTSRPMPRPSSHILTIRRLNVCIQNEWLKSHNINYYFISKWTFNKHANNGTTTTVIFTTTKWLSSYPFFMVYHVSIALWKLTEWTNISEKLHVSPQSTNSILCVCTQYPGRLFFAQKSSAVYSTGGKMRTANRMICTVRRNLSVR